MRHSRAQGTLLASAALWLALASSGPAAVADDGDAARTRRFEFCYAVVVRGLAPRQVAKVWMPVPPTTAEQTARIVSQTLPGASQLAREAKYGNSVLFVEAAADADGNVNAEVVYDVTRRELRAAPGGDSVDAASLARHLQPDALVPLEGKPLKLLEGVRLPTDQMALGRALYDLVNSHMRYSKQGWGWGRGDAVWACDSKYGNCSDFHSLFISLARSQGLPAKFEIGFPLPPERGQGKLPGYHCWAQFKPRGRGWVPVDISEANKNPELAEYYFGNLTENRLTLSVGRDLVLVPPQEGRPLNYFVYPYVEVAGKPYPPDKVEGRYAYRDILAP